MASKTNVFNESCRVTAGVAPSENKKSCGVEPSEKKKTAVKTIWDCRQGKAFERMFAILDGFGEDFGFQN